MTRCEGASSLRLRGGEVDLARSTGFSHTYSMCRLRKAIRGTKGGFVKFRRADGGA